MQSEYVDCMHADASLRNPMHGTATQTEPTTCSVPEAAKVLGVSVRTTWTLVGAGTIPSLKIRGSRKVMYADLQEYLRQQREREQCKEATS